LDILINRPRPNSTANSLGATARRRNLKRQQRCGSPTTLRFLSATNELVSQGLEGATAVSPAATGRCLTLLEALPRGPTQKMLHSPTAGLQAAERDGGDERVALTNTLWRLCLQRPMHGQR
jgi:glutamyl-tRNA reductase